MTRLLIVLAAAGAAMMLLVWIAAWRNQRTRRLNRGLRAILGGDVQAQLTDPKAERGIAFSFRLNRIVVAWDSGSWGLGYGLEELAGAEAIIDGEVAGFAYPSGARWRRKLAKNAGEFVALRLIFNDSTNPDFVLDLRERGDTRRTGGMTREEAIAEVMSWLTRLDSLLNRSGHSWWETPAPAARRPTAAQIAESRAMPAFRWFAVEADETPIEDTPLADAFGGPALAVGRHSWAEPVPRFGTRG